MPEVNAGSGMAGRAPRKIAVSEVPANRRRGGDLRTLLSPATAGSTSGFMGVATLRAGEYISEHYHPYSEEFLYVVSGDLLLAVDGERISMGAGEGILLPIGARHRLTNAGAVPVSVVFHLGPLAPRPELGHVDTEPYPVSPGERDQASAGGVPGDAEPYPVSSGERDQAPVAGVSGDAGAGGQ